MRFVRVPKAFSRSSEIDVSVFLRIAGVPATRFNGLLFRLGPIETSIRPV